MGRPVATMRKPKARDSSQNSKYLAACTCGFASVAGLLQTNLKFMLASGGCVTYIIPRVRGLSAVGSAPPCQGGGRGFEPRSPLHESSGADSIGSFHIRRDGQVVRQRPAKPLSPVRIRVSPPTNVKGTPRGALLLCGGVTNVENLCARAPVKTPPCAGWGSRVY